MKKHTFIKEERLCSKRSIDDLFRNGSSFVLYPYRVIFFRKPDTETGTLKECNHTGYDDVPVSVLFSVPKRKFRHAVDRNLIRRRMREAYRLQKSTHLFPFFISNDIQILMAIQYIAKDISDFGVLYKRMEDLFLKLRDEYTAVYLGQDH